ncbi:MAG TPA: hypothetical protein VMJ64_16260 [Anaerolineales bacterium]|nr:hypothetical protein [Anaerolineales bacterium]
MQQKRCIIRLPSHNHTTEGKKTKYDAAEYDEEFFDRLDAMGNDDFMAYMEALSKEERKAVMAAIYRALSQRAVREHIEYLQMGLRF